MRLIDADKLIITLNERQIEGTEEYKGLGEAKLITDNAPTVEWNDIELMGYVNGKQITIIKPSKIEGHWITMDSYPHRIYCSICKVTFADEKWEVWKDGSLPRNYCPNCGARMNP